MSAAERLKHECKKIDECRLKDSEVFIKVRTLDELIDDLAEKDRLINTLREELAKRAA